jgi:effector-binding domain-containing protein
VNGPGGFNFLAVSWQIANRHLSQPFPAVRTRSETTKVACRHYKDCAFCISWPTARVCCPPEAWGTVLYVTSLAVGALLEDILMRRFACDCEALACLEQPRQSIDATRRREMSAVPKIVTRAEQRYMAIRERVTMEELGGLGARFGEVFAWLGARGLEPAGPPFFRYIVIDMTRQLEVEAGVPVATAVDGDDRVVADVLPAGRYATLTHVGPPSELIGVNKTLLVWADAQGLRWDMSPGDNGERWGSRLEIYLTDPSEEPDMSKWQTQLAFRLAD